MELGMGAHAKATIENAWTQQYQQVIKPQAQATTERKSYY
jgi:hypothetical protein